MGMILRAINASRRRLPPLMVKRWMRKPQLLAIAADTTQPAIARATALAGINVPTNRTPPDALAEGLRDPNSVVRLWGTAVTCSTRR